MSKIVQLSSHVANMIAAGEVVESPLSVVKELVENSIDANATNIEINLIESGIRQVEIVDNGCGMDNEDAILAFSRHATSKIRNAYDLASIKTLGFRGEALPSIASVSTLELYTKTSDAEAGFKVTFKAGKLIDSCSAACNNGTRIVVKDLFYNTPARLKYLKSPNVILAQIADLVDKLALSHRDIRFKLTNNNQTLLNTSGHDSIISLFGQIYGANIAKIIVEEENEYDGTKVKCYFTSPVITRSRKNDITVVVNGRYVKSTVVINAVCDAYKDFVPPYRYPIALIDIEIDPLLIDVNVHPQKMDIKFSIEESVSKVVKDAIIKGLKKLTIIPTFTEVTVEKPKVEPINFDEYVSFEPKAETLAETTIQEEIKPMEEPALEEVLTQTKYTPKGPQVNEVKVEVKPTKKLPYLEYIGQYAGTYLLFQNEDGLYLVDQHAAQERCNYEYFYNVLGDPKKESLPLLIPFNLEFTNQEYQILSTHLKELESVGFVLETSGIHSFFVREIPTWIKADKPEEMTEKILYFLLEKNSFDIHLVRDSLAKLMACKASIKANHYVTKEEAYSLLSDLEGCDNPFNCPHGRPVFVQITNYDIEKLFKRIV